MAIDIKEVVAEIIQPPENLVELAFMYKASDWYANLSHATQSYYEYYILILLKSPYGKKKLNEITPRTAELIAKSIESNHGINVVRLFIAVWGRIYKFARNKGWIDVNPWSDIARKKSKARITVWTEKHVMDIVKAALEQKKEYIAKGVMLMYDTAQRPGDVLAMTHSLLKSDEDGVYIELFQKKTGTLVKVAITQYTARLVGDGKPWDYLVGDRVGLNVFRNEFRKLADKIGFSKALQLRDLRRTALTEAGDGGASDDELMANSGHKNRGMLDIYSVKTRSKALAAHRARYANRFERFS